MKGRIYLALKDYKEAISAYKRMANYAPILGKQRIAAVYGLMGEYDNAIKELKELLVEGTDRINISMQVINLYIKNKDYKAAETTAKDIILTVPESDAGYVALAKIFFSTREYSKAVYALKEAEKINPDNVKTKITIGNAYVQMKDYDNALNAFHKLAEANPEYAPAYFFQANTLELMGKRKEAVEKHEKAIKISPDYVPSLNNLAYLYAEGFGLVEKAEGMARRAKEIAPKDGSIADTLGWTLFKKGDYDEASEYFLEASKYMPEDPTIKYHLALAYLKKGMRREAEAQLKDAIIIGGKTHFSELEDAQRLLEGIRNK
jgi:tetratricopeptide (TPR) repeat protein